MTFSYSNNPGTSSRDLLRFLTGETTQELSVLSDEEIDYLLTQQTDVTQAAITAVKRILAALSQDNLVSADGITRDIKGRREALTALLTNLKQETILTGTGAVPFVGGVSRDEEETQRERTDRVPHSFELGRDDYDQLVQDPEEIRR